MKFNLIAAGALLMAVCSCTAKNEVHLSFADGLEHPDTIYVEHSLISNQLNAKSADDLKTVIDTIVPKNGVYTFAIDPEGPAEYWMRISNVAAPSSIFSIYAAPGENIKVDIKKLNPTYFSASGSALMEGIAKITDQVNPIEENYAELMKTDNPGMDKIMDLTKQYVKVMMTYVKENPDSPAVAYALNEIAQDDSFGDLYSQMTAEAKKSILFPITERYFEAFQTQLEAQKKNEAMSSGTTPAPAFTLPDLQGKKVSLSDFRGKWVVLDFWGSWCGWCIKGFPELKEAYAKYHQKGLEVIGIDCGDTESEWKDAVKKYELPWVHLYNGEGKDLTNAYSIQGFPTKIIINPEGIIVNVTVGEDPKFFDALAGFMK